MQVTCSDLNCKHNTAGQCKADGINHTSERFCTTGRKQPQDNNYRELMSQVSPGCHKAGRGKYQSNKVTNVLK